MRLVCTLLVVLVLASVSHAKPVSFIWESRSAVFINGYHFQKTSYTITAKGDTRNIQDGPFSGDNLIKHDSAQIEINGVGTFEFVTETYTFVSRTSVVGFAKSWGDLIRTGMVEEYRNWDMRSSIGPHTTLRSYYGWNYGPLVFITPGYISMSNHDVPVTFSAIVSPVPEPSSIMLAAGSLLLFALRRQH